jgi:hypothetical protein
MPGSCLPIGSLRFQYTVPSDSRARCVFDQSSPQQTFSLRQHQVGFVGADLTQRLAYAVATYIGSLEHTRMPEKRESHHLALDLRR